MADTDTLEFSVLEQAARWFAVLGAADVSAEQRAAWRHWMDAAPEHREAWRRVENIHTHMQSLHGAPGVALAGMPKRRTALKMLLLLCAGGGVGALMARREQAGEYLAAIRADHSTAVGVIAALPMPDRTQAWLNTDSAADLAYDGQQRLIVLHRGEILLHSGADIHSPARPLVVQARGVRLRALGTRFSVRMDGVAVRLAVYDGAVEINGGTVVPAGSQADIIDGQVGEMKPAQEIDAAWSRKLLIATQMRLDEFLKELGRYRRGYLGCDPSVASVRLVGSFPLDDTEQALELLQSALPVRVERVLPWWVTVKPRQS
jgi:transmembrane sensor